MTILARSLDGRFGLFPPDQLKNTGTHLSEQADSQAAPEKPLILAVATQGSNGDDEARLLTLLERLSPEVAPFNRRNRWRSFRLLLSTLLRRRPSLVVMEGTGWAGGLAVWLGRVLAGVPYVVSSGDAVGPFVAVQRPLLGPLFALYERLLCRWSAGYIGWTPYLTGRALTLGAPRAMTAPGWAPFPRAADKLAEARARIRSQLGIPANDLVFGLVGSLAWTHHVNYCYGLELIRAFHRSRRPNVKVLIVGDGTGRTRLEKEAGPCLGRAILLPGRIPREQVPDYLAALDVASLPQSVDRVGSFRYTTKLSEYLAAGLAVVTGQIPLAYDLGDDWLWRLPGNAPWDEKYVHAMSELMTKLTPAELQAKRSAVPRNLPEFDRASQVNRVTGFVNDLLKETANYEPRQ